MDDSFLIVLVIGFVISIPVVAIIALVRTGTLRRRLEENYQEFRDKFTDLTGEVARLKRELAQLSKHSDERNAAASTAAAVEVKNLNSDLKRDYAPAQTVKTIPVSQQESPAPGRVAEPQVDVQAAFVSPAPQVYLKQREAVPVPPKPETVAAVLSSHPVVDTVATTADSAPSNDAAWLQHLAQRGAVPRRPGTSIKDEYAEFVAARAVPTHVKVQVGPTPSAPFVAEPPRKSLGDHLRSALPFEELLGMNLFAKIGIVLLVLGFALLGRVALISMGPGPRVAMIYAVAAAMLGGGIWLEGRERYRLIGRTGIGGGWALLFFTTYAMYHVPAMTVMSSNTLNCILMLGVAIAMVAHTLRYKSQLVTGLAFLLAFSTIALSQD